MVVELHWDSGVLLSVAQSTMSTALAVMLGSMVSSGKGNISRGHEEPSDGEASSAQESGRRGRRNRHTDRILADSTGMARNDQRHSERLKRLISATHGAKEIDGLDECGDVHKLDVFGEKRDGFLVSKEPAVAEEGGGASSTVAICTVESTRPLEAPHEQYALECSGHPAAQMVCE